MLLRRAISTAARRHHRHVRLLPAARVTRAGAAGPNSEAATRRQLISSLTAGATGAALVIGGAAGFRLTSAAVVSGLPKPPTLPQGTFPVGVTETRVGDEGSRIRARVFYPAEPGPFGSFSAASEAPYFPFGRDTSDALAGLVYFPTFLLSHLATAKSGCVSDAPFASSVESCRTVVYSHGMGGNADMGAYAMRRMAAQGMIVVALEHQDGSASFARDEGGARVPFDGGRGRGFKHRVREVIGAARTLRQSLSEPLDGALAERISPERLAVGGHSYGVPTAMAACQNAPGIFQHAVLHDPAITPATEVAAGGTGGVPALYVLGDSYRASRQICAGVEKALEKSGPGSSVWHMAGAEHGNFVDAALWAPLWVMRNLPLIPAAGQKDPAEVHDEMASSAMLFFESGTLPAGSAASVEAMLAAER